MLMGDGMALADRNISLDACIVALVATLLLCVSAWGADGGKVPGQTAPAQPGPAAAQAGGTIDDEIARTRADIKANPANASCLVRLGYLLVRKGTLDEAMSTFDEALKINPRACDAKTGRGAVLARRGSLKEAEQTLKGALLLNPNPVRAHYELGLVYEKLGDPVKAVAEFKEGIKKHEQGRE
jgi:cytochrome c-type biogenesis protein CcmH/NrfG